MHNFYTVIDIYSGLVVSTTKDIDKAAELLTPGRCWAGGATRSEARHNAREAAKLFRIAEIQGVNHEPNPIQAAAYPSEAEKEPAGGDRLEAEAEAALPSLLQ